MDIFDNNIKKEVSEYENNLKTTKEESFLSQFKLQEIDTVLEGSKEKYSELTNPSIYNINRKDFSMAQANRFDNLKMAPSGRRDNTLVINENFVVTQKKVENDTLIKPRKNINARFASGVIYNNNLDKFKDRITINKNNNEYDKDKMYLRTENIDGVPINENVRVLPKTQSSLRTNTVNSQRLSSTNRLNKVQQAITRSKDPEKENITKFKTKTYREQKEPADFLRTTGVLIKPEQRTKIELTTNRTISKPIIGAAKTPISNQQMRNNQPLKETVKEQTIENNHITAIKSNVDKPYYKNNQKARTTGREENNEHITNPKSVVDASYKFNDQPANQTLRGVQNDQITNVKSNVDKTYYKNNQKPVETFRETSNDQITNPKSFVDKSYYHNNQKLRETLRETSNEQITNAKASVDKSYFIENQVIQLTITDKDCVEPISKTFPEIKLKKNSEVYNPNLFNQSNTFKVLIEDKYQTISLIEVEKDNKNITTKSNIQNNLTKNDVIELQKIITQNKTITSNDISKVQKVLSKSNVFVTKDGIISEEEIISEEIISEDSKILREREKKMKPIKLSREDVIRLQNIISQPVLITPQHVDNIQSNLINKKNITKDDIVYLKNTIGKSKNITQQDFSRIQNIIGQRKTVTQQDIINLKTILGKKKIPSNLDITQISNILKKDKVRLDKSNYIILSSNVKNIQVKDKVKLYVFKNKYNSNKTIREQTENNQYTGTATGFTLGTVHHNDQDARTTIKEQTVEQDYSGVGYRDSVGKLYKNNQEAQPTLREVEPTVSGSVYANIGNVYHNKNLANHTIRQDTGTSTYSGPFNSGNNRIYIKSVDKTRSGVVEEVLPHNYKGGSGSHVTETQSRDSMKNYEQYERLEQGLDLTKIQPFGGREQLNLGSTNFGRQDSSGKRGIKDDIKIPKSLVGSNYVVENKKDNSYLNTRGKELLQKRMNINPHLEASLNGNPYINNNVYKSISKKDIISKTTYKSDRILDENKIKY